MRLSRSLLLSLSITAPLISGCASAPPPPAPPKPPAIASDEQAGEVQMDLSKFAPGAHVGRVQMVSASDGMLAITGIDSKDVKIGDVITILDVDHNTVANGTVNSMPVENAVSVVVVQFDTAAGSRAPMKGDLAITKLIGN